MCSLENIAILIFVTFDLKLSITSSIFWRRFGSLIPRTIIFVIETPKRHILVWVHVVWGVGLDRENPSTRFWSRRQEKKEEKAQTRNISAILGADPFWPISTRIGTVVAIDDVIMQSNFGFGFHNIHRIQICTMRPQHTIAVCDLTLTADRISQLMLQLNFRTFKDFWLLQSGVPCCKLEWVQCSVMLIRYFSAIIIKLLIF